jgi:hypothetical protein
MIKKGQFFLHCLSCENEEATLLPYIRNHSLNDTPSHYTEPQPSATMLGKPQIKMFGNVHSSM